MNVARRVEPEPPGRPRHSPTVLLSKTAAYLIARGLPGLLNFVGLAIYTRLLSPSEYGRYALVFAAATFVDLVLFQWARQYVRVHYLPGSDAGPDTLARVLFFQACLTAGVVVLGGSALAIGVDEAWRMLFTMALPFIVLNAWLELTLAVASTRLDALGFGALLGTKVALTIATGTALALAGLGALAPLLGLATGCAAAALTFGRRYWQGIRPTRPSAEVVRHMLRYALPLSGAFALGWTVALADRVMLKGYVDAAAVGLYAASADLAQFGIGTLVAVVQLTTLPLATRALASGGVAAARAQLLDSAELLLTVSVVPCACLAVLAGPVSALVFGTEFAGPARVLIAWLAAGAVLAGLKTGHFDCALYLVNADRVLLASVAVGASANVLANLVLIPWYGMPGAAAASIVANALALYASAALGRRRFPLPSLRPVLCRVALVAAASAAAAALGLTITQHGPVAALALGGAGAGLAFLLSAAAVDLAGMRSAMMLAWRRAG